MSATQSFARHLFFGELPEELIFPYPRLQAGEQATVRRLLRAWQDLRREPALVLPGLAAGGFFGLSIPTDLGGLGLSAGATCRVFQEIAAGDAAAAVLLCAHLSLGCRALLLFGSEAQRRRYLPELASGSRRCAYAQAEPHSGSDAASIRTHATADADGYLLNGTKIWVTGGAEADLYVLFAQTGVVREGARVDRITAFLVERGPGVRPGPDEPRLALQGAPATALYIDDVHVPRDAVLGTVGGGVRVAMETASSARLAIAASCIGVARECFSRALLHATTRRQFGRLLSTFGMIKDKLAQMQVDLYAAESMLYLTCGLSQRGDTSLETACCKVFASEMLARVAAQAMDLSGGAGLMRDYPFEGFLRASRFFLVFGGTNEVLRCYIALTGMHGPGEHLAKLSDAIKHPLRGYGLVMDSLIGQVRSAAYGGPALTLHHPRLKKEAVGIEDSVEALQKGIDRVLRRHGRQISEMQYVQRRVADVAIDLYAMLACVSRTSASLRAHDMRRLAGSGAEAAGLMDEAERELRLCRGFCQKALARVRTTLERFNDNDDELMKAIAEDSYHGRAYPFDGALD